MILRAENIQKIYGSRKVVQGISLEVKQGEIIGLLGPNGAGKTTCFYMIVGMIKPNEGHIYLNDEEITNDAMYRRAQKGIGYLAQEASVFRKLSVEDNIMSVLQFTKLSKSDQKRIGEIILKTDPVSVSAAHVEAQKLSFDINKFEWQCVLIQEADVLASALPEMGQFLTECLAREWSYVDVELASGLLSPEGRESFLQYGALFSSPASNRLGIPEVVFRQLAALRSDKCVVNST